MDIFGLHRFADDLQKRLEKSGLSVRIGVDSGGFVFATTTEGGMRFSRLYTTRELADAKALPHVLAEREAEYFNKAHKGLDTNQG